MREQAAFSHFVNDNGDSGAESAGHGAHVSGGVINDLQEQHEP
jgi:hypothetical protein